MLSVSKRLRLVTHEPRTYQAELCFGGIVNYSPQHFVLAVHSQPPCAGACLLSANPSAARVRAGNAL